MDSSGSLKAWQLFLQGRIADESQNYDSAKTLYDAALAIDSNNPHFLQAKKNVEAISASKVEAISKAYGIASKTYVGAKDNPESWIKELTSMLDTAKTNRGIDALAVVW